MQGFDEEEIRKCLMENFNRLQASEFHPSPTDSQHYFIKKEFDEKDRYWIKKACGEPFIDSLTSGILYRPEIVSELVTEVESALTAKVGRGIMIKGPHGIGKSHSIVNLIRKLLYGSEGKYFVTFIPDCRHWKGVHNLYDAICQSLGSTREELSIQTSGPDIDSKLERLADFVEFIDKILAEQNRQWIFIFDKINDIFGRPDHRGISRITQLRFPFPFMQTVMKSYRITSIISASANNEASYQDYHDGFTAYNHRFCFNEQEINIVFPLYNSYDDERNARLKAKTGLVPLQVHNLVSKYSLNFEEYEAQTKLSIDAALNLLKISHAPFFETVSYNASCCVLSLPVEESNFYDRKYSFYDHEDGTFKPVFPLVLDAYQEFFWQEVMKKVEESVTQILEVCNDPHVTSDVRERLFELLIIRRCQGRSLLVNENGRNDADLANFTGLQSCRSVHRFTGETLPDFTDDGLYVPKNSNFPAVDLIWKMQESIWFVQVHVSEHDEVSPVLHKMIKSALSGGGMIQGNLFLLYLSPRQEISAPHSAKYGLPRNNAEGEPLLRIVAKPMDMFTCYENLRWLNV